MTVEEIMSEVEKDISYYNNSGGGITLFGGEPLYQFDFSLALLQKCRERGINTCIETYGVYDSYLHVKCCSEIYGLLSLKLKITSGNNP